MALVVGLVVGLGAWLVPIGAVLAGVGALAWWRRGYTTLTSTLGAVEVDDPASPAVARLGNLVEGLCIANGIAVPTLALVDSPARNAAAVADDSQASWLVVTRGLLDDLSRIELEAVVARELARLKSGEATLVSTATLLSRVWSGLPARILDARADVVADLDAVALTRYPPGLLDALVKVEEHALVEGVAVWTGPLWIEDPVGSARGRADTVRTPIEERISTLREL